MLYSLQYDAKIKKLPQYTKLPGNNTEFMLLLRILVI